MAEAKMELTTKDLTKMFDCSRQSIFNWRKKENNPLRFYKLSGNGLADPTRYRLADVHEFSELNAKPIINTIYIPPVI